MAGSSGRVGKLYMSMKDIINNRCKIFGETANKAKINKLFCLSFIDIYIYIYFHVHSLVYLTD